MIWRRRKKFQSTLSLVVSNFASKPAKANIGKATGMSDKRNRSESMNIKAAKMR